MVSKLLGVVLFVQACHGADVEVASNPEALVEVASESSPGHNVSHNASYYYWPGMSKSTATINIDGLNYNKVQKSPLLRNNVPEVIKSVMAERMGVPNCNVEIGLTGGANQVKVSAIALLYKSRIFTDCNGLDDDIRTALLAMEGIDNAGQLFKVSVWVGPPPPTTVASLDVQGLDYNAMARIPALMADVQRSIQRDFAYGALVVKKYVEVNLACGTESTLVTVVISPPDGTVQGEVAADIARTVEEGIYSILGIRGVLSKRVMNVILKSVATAYGGFGAGDGGDIGDDSTDDDTTPSQINTPGVVCSTDYSGIGVIPGGKGTADGDHVDFQCANKVHTPYPATGQVSCDNGTWKPKTFSFQSGATFIACGQSEMCWHPPTITGVDALKVVQPAWVGIENGGVFCAASDCCPANTVLMKFGTQFSAGITCTKAVFDDEAATWSCGAATANSAVVTGGSGCKDNYQGQGVTPAGAGTAHDAFVTFTCSDASHQKWPKDGQVKCQDGGWIPSTGLSSGATILACGPSDTCFEPPKVTNGDALSTDVTAYQWLAGSPATTKWCAAGNCCPAGKPHLTQAGNAIPAGIECNNGDWAPGPFKCEEACTASYIGISDGNVATPTLDANAMLPGNPLAQIFECNNDAAGNPVTAKWPASGLVRCEDGAWVPKGMGGMEDPSTFIGCGVGTCWVQPSVANSENNLFKGITNTAKFCVTNGAGAAAQATCCQLGWALAISMNDGTTWTQMSTGDGIVCTNGDFVTAGKQYQCQAAA